MSTCKVEMIQASRCKNTGKEIFTMVCEYPRVIHAQLLTHGVFSKNSSSTRAIPLKTAIQQVRDNPSKVIWTENRAGMQGNVITDQHIVSRLNCKHRNELENVISFVETLEAAGVHKQNAGRYLEPFQNIKIVLTATEWENWDWLRIHEDAQGEIADLALAMKEARDNADIMEIGEGEWHVPFVGRVRTTDDKLNYVNTETSDASQINLSVEEAKAISVSVCAQTSYRKADYSLEKALKMKGMLTTGHKVHASPFEHQATTVPKLPSNTMPVSNFLMRMPKGVTHMDRAATPCSGNFKQWIQLRQLIPNHDAAYDTY
jgi:hypothetical protein